MTTAKYGVGQMVDFNPGRGSMPAESREYKVLRLMPREAGQQTYRIKSITELYERIANEPELSKRS